MRYRVFGLVAASLGLLLAQACSGDDSSQSDGGSDGSIVDSSKEDAAPNDAAKEAESTDGGDAGCPQSWTAAPTVDPSIEVPDGGGTVQVHAAATGTQDYTCEATTTDAGTTYAWVFVGPEATLDDCSQNVIAHHFAADGGSPEWQATDQSFIIGKKVAGFTPDGGSGSIPWLLLQAVTTSGSGLIGTTTYVQRLDTDGGNAPTTTCDGQNVGTTSKTPYAADYYFYGN